MKDTKTVSLLFISLLLLLLASLVLLFTWGYNKFYKTQTEPVSQLIVKNKTSVDDYRDSLQKLYTSTINNINTKMDATVEHTDSLHLNSDISPVEFYKLKTEIENILKNHPLKADLDVARQKILELQYKLAELQNKNISVEEENKRLNGKLNQLTHEIKKVEQNIKPDVYENIVPAKNTTQLRAFTISQLSISAVIDDDGVQHETLQAKQANRLVGSFTFTAKKNFSEFSNADIFAIVLQPNGHTMQGSEWESGAFDTHEGRKIYSSKLHFENSQGESKHLSFSLSADTFQKGRYTIQLYYDGIMIGKAFRTLM